MSKRSFRTALAVVIGSIAIVVGIAVFFISRAFAYPDKAHEGDGREVEVEIVSGMSFPQIASLLSEKDLLDKPTWFRLFAMWNGKTADVKTGKYVIKDNLTPREVLDIIVTGVKEVTVAVKLKEGEHMLELFRVLEEKGVAPAKELEALARDKVFLGKHAITGDTAEGYLFPDTYQFRKNDKPERVLARLITKHQEVWNELVGKHVRDREKLKDKLGWSDRDILTLASIVEKEAAVDQKVHPLERPRIAQVFVNRLASPTFRPKRLETDPTIRYGCTVPLQRSLACTAWHEPCLKAGKPLGCDRLHREQLDDKDNPYNTYQHEGLPPGPISNPGRASIEAALAPDGSDYYFFVANSKTSRTHAFARTLEEHRRNVEKYLKSGEP
ncbi:MAG: endolytic transglycosylase MltG [Deltaproteobacteria bacterium]|nr:endolytic transglycosylase MltG [Deltaproteobacteria bacterium]MCW5803299.1 endolytic transglycosylase MltG [Deltaproteobacteria bacterium]